LNIFIETARYIIKFILIIIPFHLNTNLSQSNAFSHVAMNAYSFQSVNIQELINAYQYRIYKLDFCFSNFHIFRLLRSGKREVDVNSFMSKHSSDYNALFCYDPLAQLAIVASSRMKSCQSHLLVKFLNEEKSSFLYSL